MRYIAAEDVAKAKEMDLLTYLRNYEPQELVCVSRCYEHIFLFSKSKKYFFDYKAISEPIAPQRQNVSSAA